MKRILITGSRNYTDKETIRKLLLEHGPGTVVHGACHGADNLAAEIAKELGWPTEAHPAQWRLEGRRAGPIRNSKMVNLGADICLAFPLPSSVGTYDCIRKAIAAHIKVVRA